MLRKADIVNMKSFFFHYNKPQSKKLDKPIISLHFNNKCHLVSGMTVNVPTKAMFHKQQPRFTINGKYNKIKIKNGFAEIN